MKLAKWLDEHFEEAFLGLLLAVMACVLLLQIVMRYVFKASLPWPEELSRYMFVVMGFVSIPYCMRKGISLKVDIIVTLLPKALQTVMDVISRVIEVIFYLFLFRYSFPVLFNAYNSLETTPALKIPIWVVYLIVCIALGLGFLRGVQGLLIFFKKLSSKEVEAK